MHTFTTEKFPYKMLMAIFKSTNTLILIKPYPAQSQNVDIHLLKLFLFEPVLIFGLCSYVFLLYVYCKQCQVEIEFLYAVAYMCQANSLSSTPFFVCQFTCALCDTVSSIKKRVFAIQQTRNGCIEVAVYH